MESTRSSMGMIKQEEMLNRVKGFKTAVDGLEGRAFTVKVDMTGHKPPVNRKPGRPPKHSDPRP